MQKMLRNIVKFFFYLSYPILVAALVVTATLLLIKTAELDRVNNTFAEATQSLNSENQNQELTIDGLKNQFEQLNQEIAELRSENQQLKDQADNPDVTGFGVIEGEIFPVVSEEQLDFNQTQTVCAADINVATNVRCLTVSALQRDFTLPLPEGTYQVYAELSNGRQAFYTNNVRCSNENDENCEANNSKANVVVSEGERVSNIDPVDWR